MKAIRLNVKLFFFVSVKDFCEGQKERKSQLKDLERRKISYVILKYWKIIGDCIWWLCTAEFFCNSQKLE